MSRPLLWHIPTSHYSEKVRWALDHKRIPHRRRVMPPGIHPIGGLLVTRGRAATVPVMVLDGEPVPDSTAILAALERRWPERPLYPADPAERERALALEDFFDEQLGHHARRLVFHELLAEPESRREVAEKQLEWAPAVPAGAAAGLTRRVVNVRYRTDDDAGAQDARLRIVAALDRLEDEVGGSGFLVGDSFTVADLTAAALFYPIVLPPEGPWQPVNRPAGLERFRASLASRPGYRWVQETFRRRWPAGPNGSV